MRTRICLWFLILAPFVVYGPAIVGDYGLRDDYSHMREAHEEPGKLVKFNTSQGRPLCGALLETTFAQIKAVEDLVWLRLVSVALLALLAIVLWRQFDYSGWPEVDAAAAAAAIVLLPAAQISAGWAIGWPWVLALLLAVAGFAAVETEVEKGGLKRWLGAVGGMAIYVLAALIYQSNLMFAVVPIAAAALPRAARRTRAELTRWLVMHLLIIAGALVISYFLLQLLFSGGVFHASPRMQLETNPFTKLLWFFWQPLPNALALYALRDDFNTGAIVFWLAALGVTGFLAWIARIEPNKEGGVDRYKWWICLGLLPWVAHAISLLAAERSTGYRTLYALSSLVVVTVFTGLRRLPLDKKIEPFVRYAVISLLLVVAGALAWRNTTTLMAEPQEREWRLVSDAVMRARFKDKEVTRFYLIEPALADRSTAFIHQDEFGSLSTNSDWVPKEMFKAAYRERFAEGPRTEGTKTEKTRKSLPRYEFSQGKEAPAQPKDFDVIIDMRRLKAGRE